MSRLHAVPRALAMLPLLALLLIAAAWISVGLGEHEAGWSEMVDVLRGSADAWSQRILLSVRLPRIALAALVGAALAGAGVVFQAVLRNPLADPYILGVSGGAALGAMVFAAVLGAADLGHPLGRPVAAFLGALTTLLFLALARVRGRTEPTTLLLVGVVLNAIDSAIILFLLTASDSTRFQEALVFLVGRIHPFPSWELLAVLTGLLSAGLLLLMALSHRLNLLAFGEEVAGQLGIDVEWTIWVAVVAASLVTAVAVSFTGLVGFVGLIVPHIGRTLLGADHRLLLPASVLAGASFVVLADTVARTVVAPVELPVGVITALVGGPFFLVLFLRYLRKSR